MTEPSGSTRIRAWALAALVGYGAVVVSLTMLKAFFVIGHLWRTEAQRNRSMEWEPFALYRNSTTWFGPLFDYLGNVAFFIPLGILLFVVLEPRGRRAASGAETEALTGKDEKRLARGGVGDVVVVVVIGALISATVESLQYLFSLGHSDVTDLLMNTTGALIGALVAWICGPRAYPLWIGLGLVTSAVFAILVILGPRLGDPGKVVEVASGRVAAEVQAGSAASAASAARP